MDKRYVEIIAQNMKYKSPAWMNYLLVTTFIIGSIGFVALFRQLAWGYLLAISGTVLFIIDYYFITKFRIKAASDFLKEYEKTGNLPPWPEKA
jgi:hypothetical protein